MDETRQSPEQILKQIEKEEQSRAFEDIFRICRRRRQNLCHAESRTFGKEARC